MTYQWYWKSLWPFIYYSKVEDDDWAGPLFDNTLVIGPLQMRWWSGPSSLDFLFVRKG